jgi:indole-3-glycerol phosphate synthase
VTYLTELLARRRAHIALEKDESALARFKKIAARRAQTRGFAAALRGRRPAIIAEIKRTSPSAGPISPHCDAAAVARAYQAGGAVAISVLTEPEHFGGSFEDLAAARAAVSLPILCKDFVMDEFQIWKAAAYGADALLLIVAALDRAQLVALMHLCRSAGIEALVEVHTDSECQRAAECGATLIGINNRDLKSMQVDVATAPRLRRTLPARCTVVAESGYRHPAQLAEAAAAGIDAVLIGETLMRAPDPMLALRCLEEVASLW